MNLNVEKLDPNVDKNNTGLYANLFYYDPITKTLLIQDISKIDNQGNVVLTFTHASNYVIVMSDKALLKSEMDKISMSPMAKTLYFGGTTGKSTLMNAKMPKVITR